MNCLQIPLKSYSNEQQELCLIGSGPSFQSTPDPTTIVITSIMILPAVATWRSRVSRFASGSQVSSNTSSGLITAERGG